MPSTSDQPPSPESLQRGYESLSVSNRGLLIFVICFVLVGAGVQWGLWGFLNGLGGITREADVPQSAVPQVNPFAAPHLQPTEQHPHQPSQDLEALRNQDRSVFQKLGWSTDSAGTPVIPQDVIDQLKTKHAKSASTRPTTQGGGT